VCREHVGFVINWAWDDKTIQKAFAQWLKTPGRRPHKQFEYWKGTKASEHLSKLGALRILNTGISADQAVERYSGQRQLLVVTDDNYK